MLLNDSDSIADATPHVVIRGYRVESEAVKILGIDQRRSEIKGLWYLYKYSDYEQKKARVGETNTGFLDKQPY